MKVITYHPNSRIHPFRNEDSYWIETSKDEFYQLIYPLLPEEEKRKIDQGSRFYIADESNVIATKGHFYFMTNYDWTKIMIERWSYPASSQFDGDTPFRKIEQFTFSSLKEFQEKTYINPADTNLLYFSALLPEKFPDEFARIQAILDKYRIDYRFLKGTRDIWCRDYMPVQISEKDFIQFRYEPTYLKTKKDLKTRSDPRLVNPENGFSPDYSNINLDGGNVVRYKEKVMITARVFKENQNSGLSKEEIRDQLGKELRAHVIIIPEHPADQIDHADGNVRFLDEHRVLINELKREYLYWREGMEKIRHEQGLSYMEIPWFTPKSKKDSLSALGYYINFLEVGNLIIIPKFELEGNRDQEAYDLFKSLFPKRNIEQVNINAIAEEGGLLNCITWNIKIAKQ